MENRFEYYEKRIKELKKLRDSVKSQTLLSLIDKAINDTENSLGLFYAIEETTNTYIQSQTARSKDFIAKFKDKIQECNEHIKKAETQILIESLRDSSVDLMRATISMSQEGIRRQEKLITLVNTVLTNCHAEFEKTLLVLIFKPSAKQFHYDSVVDGLNYLITKWIPVLEEITLVKNFLVPIRKRNFAKHGDKIIIYLEQYIDILARLVELGNAYVKILST